MNTNTSLSQRLWTIVMGLGLAAYATVFVVEGVGGYI
jgi:hypothetical protein